MLLTTVKYLSFFASRICYSLIIVLLSFPHLIIISILMVIIIILDIFSFFSLHPSFTLDYCHDDDHADTGDDGCHQHSPHFPLFGFPLSTPSHLLLTRVPFFSAFLGVWWNELYISDLSYPQLVTQPPLTMLTDDSIQSRGVARMRAHMHTHTHTHTHTHARTHARTQSI